MEWFFCTLGSIYSWENVNLRVAICVNETFHNVMASFCVVLL